MSGSKGWEVMDQQRVGGWVGEESNASGRAGWGRWGAYRGERKGVEGRWGLGKVMDKERDKK